MTTRILLWAATIFLAASSFPALAEDEVCAAGNLLHGRVPVASSGLIGPAARLSDHFVGPAGAAWDGPQATVLATGASVTYDFGRTERLRALFLQADANDSYDVFASSDGEVFRMIWRAEPVAGGEGLRTRFVELPGIPARYLRLGEPLGDGSFSASELQAFCSLPSPWPPAIPVFTAGGAAEKSRPFWNNDSSARWQLVLALFGLAWFFWSRLAPTRAPAWRDRALALLGILATLTYFNFGAFHFPRFIHDWEWTHYYLGAKYFPELKYDKLYECIAIADVEAGLGEQVARRKLTNLRTNVLESTADILAHPERCKAFFSPARWQTFAADVEFFRERQKRGRWEDLQTDHGYNATPVWNLAGSLLASTAPASRGQVYTLGLLDPLYFFAMAFLMVWAFGWRTTSMALLVLATNFPSRFYWTGGSFLRWDWLFFLVAAICLLKRERPFWAGLALGYATLLRVFPLLVFAGPGLALVGLLWRRWRGESGLDLRPWWRFFAGAALAAAVLLPLGAWRAGGPEAYSRFLENTHKHQETPLTNHMGLRTLLAYRSAEAGEVLHDGNAADPWLAWKKARLSAYATVKPLHFVLMAAFLVLLALAVRGRAPWVAAALGITFVPIGVELTCYYYAFLVGIALLYDENPRIGGLLLAATAFTQFVDWRPFVAMPEWRDEQYTLMSAATVAAVVAIVSILRPATNAARLR